MEKIMVDTHSHYAHKKFDCDRKKTLESLADENVIAVIEAAISYESNKNMKKLCEKYPFVYMAVGCHPNCVAEMDEQRFNFISESLLDDKVVAVGETGLDYAHGKTPEQREIQRYWLRRFIDLAIKNNKPLVIHCREAFSDLIDIMIDYSWGENPGVIHCFSGNKKQAEKLIGMGFYLGIGGMFTKLEEDSELVCAIKDISMEKMLIETDAPFLVPRGVTGNRNTSANLKYIVEELASLKNCDVDYVLKTVLDNTRKVYPEVF